MSKQVRLKQAALTYSAGKVVVTDGAAADKLVLDGKAEYTRADARPSTVVIVAPAPEPSPPSDPKPIGAKRRGRKGRKKNGR